MSERKVLNKYYPPDFDPSKIPRNKKPKDGSDAFENIRFMLPMTVRCLNCKSYIYAGTKFNVKKELVKDQTYVGIKIYRFHLKCVSCANSISIKTDPQNASYVCEAGANPILQERSFAPKPPADDENETPNQTKLIEDGDGPNAVTLMESKRLEAQRQLQVQDELDNIRASNDKRARVISLANAMTSDEHVRKQRIVEREKEAEVIAEQASLEFWAGREGKPMQVLDPMIVLDAENKKLPFARGKVAVKRKREPVEAVKTLPGDDKEPNPSSKPGTKSNSSAKAEPVSSISNQAPLPLVKSSLVGSMYHSESDSSSSSSSSSS